MPFCNEPSKTARDPPTYQASGARTERSASTSAKLGGTYVPRLGRLERLAPRADDAAVLCHSYRQEVNGIVPGYKGHVPRARDKVGGSAVGTVPLTSRGSDERGQSSLATRRAGGGMTRRAASAPRERQSVSRRPFAADESKLQDAFGQGTVPGYLGHVRGVRAVYGASTHSSSDCHTYR